MGTTRLGDRGFSLMEVIVVLAVLAAFTGMLVPLGIQFLESRREDTSREQLLTIKRAIVGTDVLRTQTGRPLRAEARDFGFHGDLGVLPDSLAQLLERGALAAFAINDEWRLGAGWRGPYLRANTAEDEGDPFLDAFGRSVRWAKRDTVVDGVQWVGFLRSSGRDRTLDTGDDIVVPILEAEVRGVARGFLRHGSGQPISDARVEYAYRSSGAVQTVIFVTDTLGRFTGPEQPFGPAVVSAGAPGQPALGYVRNLERTFPSTRNNISFRVVNVTSRDVAITSYTATWDPLATSGCYRDGRFGGVDVSGTGANIKCSGQTLIFNQSVTVRGGGSFGASAPQQRFVVDHPSVVAPELVIAGGDLQGEALVELLDWRVSGTGLATDVSGLTISMTFSDASSATFRSP